MALFKRTRRVDLGTFQAPPLVEPAPVERVADEGLMIAKTAVRMAVKNRIIVDAIREDLDYDAAAMARAARAELESLAEQNTALARNQLTERNIRIYRSVADGLRAAAEDAEEVEQLVEDSRQAAWREISTVLRARLSTHAIDPAGDPGYESERDARLRELVEVDLARLSLDQLPEY